MLSQFRRKAGRACLPCPTPTQGASRGLDGSKLLPMGIPLKVSDTLFAVAKQEAQATQRSITAQVEHWARIGRAVEAVLAHQELLTLKHVGELLTPLYP